MLGTVTPTATVTVLPRLKGYLTEVAYKWPTSRARTSAKASFLAQIDSSQYQIDKQQAQLAKDQTTLNQAHADLARYAQLNQQKSITEQTFAKQKFTVPQDQASDGALISHCAAACPAQRPLAKQAVSR